MDRNDFFSFQNNLKSFVESLFLLKTPANFILISYQPLNCSGSLRRIFLDKRIFIYQQSTFSFITACAGISHDYIFFSNAKFWATAKFGRPYIFSWGDGNTILVRLVNLQFIAVTVILFFCWQNCCSQHWNKWKDKDLMLINYNNNKKNNVNLSF